MSHVIPIRAMLYEPTYKGQWDAFVRGAKNGVFLFYRDYLEYHADRFSDFSILFFQDERLVALLPANRANDVVVSHGGLTFGGVVTDSKMTVERMLDVFSALVDLLRARDVKKLVYKAIPHIYHVLPAEEDLYALFMQDARLFRRDVSSTVVGGPKLPLSRSRRRVLKHAQGLGLQVRPSRDFLGFMAIAEASLQARHGVRPVHTGTEMQLLADRFPENIKLFTANRNEEILGGVIMYESQMVAHGQYRNATVEGMKLGALDLIMDVLLNDVYKDKHFHDFGSSTLDDGRKLDEDLIQNKESYGGRAIVYDSYELSLYM